MSKRYTKKIVEEPVMSDRTLLLNVEDLINTAFGPINRNQMNFKLLQTTLHILAYQLHILEQEVEIKVDEITDLVHEESYYDDESGTYSSSYTEGEDDERRVEHERKRAERWEKKDRARKDEKGDEKTRGKGEKEDGKTSSKDREDKGRFKDRVDKDKRSRDRDDKNKRVRDRDDKDKRSRERDDKDTRFRDRDDKDKRSRDRDEKNKRSRDRDDKGKRSRERDDKDTRFRDRDDKDKRSRDRDDKDKRSRDRDEKDKRSRDRDDKEERSRDRDDKDTRSRDRDDKDTRSRDRDDKDARSRDRDDKDARSRDRDDKDERSRDRDDKDERSRDRDDKDERSRDRDDKRRRSRDRDDKDRSSRDRDGSPRGRRGEDYGDEGGRERRRGRKGREEREADERGGTGGEREDRYDQGQDLGGLQRRDFGRQTSGTSITGSGGRPARAASIEVVTASQFALLGKAVKQLEQITGPLPEPELPDNETLRQDLAKGRTSLPDTMQAVQLNARVQAAEQGLYRMAELLTQLAQSGVLPPEFASHVGAMEEYLQAATTAGNAPAGPGRPGKPGGPGDADGGGRTRRKPSAGPRGARSGKGKELSDGISYVPGGIGKTVSAQSLMDQTKPTISVASEPAAQVTTWVTHSEMHELLEHMKDAVYRELQKLTSHATHSADLASSMSRTVAAKMNIALQVNERVDTLFQGANDYAEQLGGLDSGITIQINSFQEQLVMMKNGLSGSLALLEAANNNAETAALLELTERHQGLAVMMDNTVHLHQDLHITQQQISDELRNLMKCVELLRERKADRDELFDGLRDKANLSRLASLLHEKAFDRARFDIEQRMSTCYKMFSRQDMKWRDALIDLMAILDKKAELCTMLEVKETTIADLNAIQQQQHKLHILLGKPKAAVLLRKVAEDASRGDSLTPALMEPQDASLGQPLPLPALRPPPLGAELQPCVPGEVKLAPPDIRDHTCHRWAGGSHTLMAGNIVKERAESMQLQNKPTKKLVAYGSDGRLYMMEEDLQPCAECNKLSTDEPGRVSPHPSTSTGAGAGDQASVPPA